MVVDEYSRFAFAYPCSNMFTSTVIRCLDQFFALCGMLSYVHSDRRLTIMSRDLKPYLTKHGVSASQSTPYHPTGNSQFKGVVELESQSNWR